MLYSVDEVLGEGFPERIVKRFGSGGGGHRRCLLYPRRTFLKLPVPTVHMFKKFCTLSVHFRFALDVTEGVATMVFPSRPPL
jgi:hypothetical protein